MSFVPENLGIASTGLPLLRDLVHERTGLFYDNGRSDMLSDRLGPLVIERGFRSFLDYYYLLKYDEREANAEWGRIMDALSVQETYFWREMDQVHALADGIMTGLARATPDGPIRIWSVPCATGEEALTIAMVLDQHGWFDRVPIEIHGSDGSRQAIAKARAGIYRDRSFRSLPHSVRERYFVPCDGGYAPVPSLAARIKGWSVVNLMATGDVAVRAHCPVVFCRNAFIYFSPQTVSHVVQSFADYMPSPGYLFLGASESLLNVTDRFRLDEVSNAFVYVKR